MSADASEFLLTSSESSQQWSACLWDFNSESGNVLQQYKGGGIAATSTFSQIGNDYFVTAEKGKPLLHVWPVNSQEQIKNVRLVLPEPAGAVAVSPDNCYLAMGIGSKLYIWQISSGKLLSIQQKHLLPITCLKFSSNADCLITTCQTGMVVTYNFGSLICLNNSQLAQSEIGQVEPLYSRRDHSGAITDLHVGVFGLKSRFATVSNDHTCRMYDLFTGQPLLQLIYNQQLTSVIFDAPCWHLYLGTNSGLIQQFNLQNPPRTMSVHTSTESNNKLNFIGHTGRVTSLDLNVTNEILVSGAEDGFVIIWNVSSRQMLNKIEHKGAITNARFIMRNENLFAQTFKRQFVLKTLQRNIDTDPNNFNVSIMQTEDINFSDDEDQVPTFDAKERLGNLEEELVRVKVINKQLYDNLLAFNERYNVK